MIKHILILVGLLLQPAIAFAVPDEIYVDPAIAANSGTGTIGDPYGDVQYALDQVNHGGDGANFNVKAGTAEVLAAGGLSLDTYFATNGAPGPTEPGSIRGYTATAGDGGIATFTGTANSAAFWVDTTTGGADTDNWEFRDLTITTGQASGYAITIDNCITFQNVTLISPHGGIDVDLGVMRGCSVSYVDTNGLLGNGIFQVFDSYFVQSSAGALVSALTDIGFATGNICDVRLATDGNNSVIRTNTSNAGSIKNNTILATLTGSGASVANGIRISGPGNVCENNYIEGFNSTNDAAISVLSTSTSSVVAGNAAYNCTAMLSNSGLNTIVIGDQTTQLVASGVTDAAGGDYTPTAALIDAGTPSDFLTLTGNANYPTVGAITTEHEAAGGGTDQVSITPFYGGDIREDGGNYIFEFGVYQNGVPFALDSGAVQGSLDSAADAATGLTLNTISTGRYEVVVNSSNAAFDGGGNLNLTLSAGTVGGNAMTGAKVGEVSIARFSAAPTNFESLSVDGSGAVIIQDGTDPGQIDTNAGAVVSVTTTGTVTNGVNVTEILGTALTDDNSSLSFGNTLAENLSIFFGEAINDTNNRVGASTIEAIKIRTDRIPNIAAGASGGLLIAGSNAATTFATLTSTGAFTVNGTTNLTVNAIQWGGTAVASAFVRSDLQRILGSSLSDTGGGSTFADNIANNLSVFFGSTRSDGQSSFGVSEVGSIKTRTDRIPNVAAGANGGLLIAGSNAATTFSTLTSTGAFTVNGSTTLTANTTQWGGTAVASANVRADMRQILGTALDDSGSASTFTDNLAGNFNIFFGNGRNDGIGAAGAADVGYIKTRTNRIPDIAAGSAGGLLIAGSNAATTFATLTVTGEFTADGAPVGEGLDEAALLAALGLAEGNLDAQLAAKPNIDDLMTPEEVETAAALPLSETGLTNFSTFYNNGSAVSAKTINNVTAPKNVTINVPN